MVSVEYVLSDLAGLEFHIRLAAADVNAADVVVIVEAGA